MFLTVFDSKANFVLFDAHDCLQTSIIPHLVEQRIAIRKLRKNW